MEAQAFLFHCSAMRCSFSDVHDAATLDEIAVQMQMEMYDVLVAHKMQEWNKIAGSVTAQRAMACDDKQFASLVGRHAHGKSFGQLHGSQRHLEGISARPSWMLATIL